MPLNSEATTFQKIWYSIMHNVWYGPLLIYTAVMTTVCFALIITGVRVG